MSRHGINKQKRAWGGAIKRSEPSQPATLLAPKARGRSLDFGCGWGFDADHYGWESYDPYYRPGFPDGEFDTIFCISVCNALSRKNRHKVIKQIKGLLADDGTAYLSVPRDLPETGKLGIHHSLQNYVVLTLPVFYEDEKICIYELRRDSKFKDKTREYMTPRDRRAARG